MTSTQDAASAALPAVHPQEHASLEEVPSSGESQDRACAAFEDYRDFRFHRALKKADMFDAHFLEFMKWFYKDIHGRYSISDFQRIQRNKVLMVITGLLGSVAVYLYCHTHYPDRALWWGAPLFAFSLFIANRGDVFHARTHAPKDLTGNRWLDAFVDYAGLAFGGSSPSLLKRRHLAAHYNDVGIASKLWSEIWLSFTKIPFTYYLRPFYLITLIRDKEFCRDAGVKPERLLVETLLFYVYLIAFGVELLVFNSYYLLVFHLIPVNIVAGSYVVSGLMIHSDTDPRNSWTSNGVLNYRTASGLLKVPLWWYSLFNLGSFENHALHHAYPQVPLDVLNDHFEEYHDHVRATYPELRYNSVLAMKIHADILKRLPKPRLFDYGVAFLICLVNHGLCTLAALGLPYPPFLFEPLLVDWRIYTHSTRLERAQQKLLFLDQLKLAEAFEEIEQPNIYLRFLFRRYTQLRRFVEAHQPAGMA